MLPFQLLTQLVILFLKQTCRRLRPGAALVKSLTSVPRFFPHVSFLDCKGLEAFESFPSGDAAGAMCFSTVLADVLGSNVAYAFAAAACFGRMYFFAHHALDVAAGAGIAYVVTAACRAIRTSAYSKILFAEDYNLWHSLVVIVVFAQAYGKIKERFNA